ncbi:MAG: inosine-5-monophosphate dehydrogenase [Candidatus Methanomethylicota archaeon]|uniref:Inosine-5-monophosphate dehydrogenase n=1 Tax=Thermoproteota archaeon TaxID=2056631 RepID=A0A523BFX7_9CREN|nr:MAG: inosine-5-monophosphate dehydrogenase [Candidatus Verstraetearchaeota archaeon]
MGLWMVRIRARVLVGDIMTKSLITLPETSTAREVAIAMSGKDVGSVIITRDSHPVGIITERDLVERVIARGLNPDITIARNIMSSPLSVIDPKAEIMEAARKMAKLRIRRLVVVDRGEMVGIITSRDILSTAPELVEVLAEAKRNSLLPSKGGEVMAGYCDNCEEWSDSLKEVNGQFLCEECRLELGE